MSCSKVVTIGARSLVPQLKAKALVSGVTEARNPVYQYQQEVGVKSSQLILDRANNFNQVGASEAGLEEPAGSSGVKRKFVLFKRQVDEALWRSEENMARCRKSKETLPASRSLVVGDESLPSNPLQKLRVNRFSSQKAAAAPSTRYKDKRRSMQTVFRLDS